jgi:Dyp-type peroxidase family
MSVQLELDDIQGTVLRSRPLPYYGAYLIFRIDDADCARAGLRRLIPHVTSAADWGDPKDDSWISVVFSAEGLRRLGIGEEDLAGFPMPFRQGMAARAAFLGDVGDNDPALWDLPHGGTGFHMAIYVMAQSRETRDAQIAIGHEAMSDLPDVHLIARQDIGAPPTFREHFGFTDGLSRPFIEGEGGSPMPGQGEPTKAGEFVLGYENELGEIARAGGPEALWRNGTFISVRKLKQDVAMFRRYLRENAKTPEGQELVAAKMMGRWRSGAPLALAPERDDPELAADPLRRNAFQYLDDDADGTKTPVGSHIRRVNPRDALDNTIMVARHHRLLRRGAAYGPAFPEEAIEDDGLDRGIVIAMINADPFRQFEFVQSQWVNDGDFISEGARSDPITGRRDVADDYAYPARPVRKHLKGMPAFSTVRGGEHVFLPGIGGLKWLAAQTGGVSARPA